VAAREDRALLALLSPSGSGGGSGKTRPQQPAAVEQAEGAETPAAAIAAALERDLPFAEFKAVRRLYSYASAIAAATDGREQRMARSS
jgi:hypothetical protein